MVNFEAGHIKIPRMVRKGRKKDVVTPLNNALTEALKKAIKISGVGRGERIFPYSVYFVDKKWGKIRKMVGLEDSVRVHDLRHTFESRTGRAAQDDPYAVQELMGHTDFGTTQKYIHLSESRNRTIMEKLDSSPIKIPNIRNVKSRKFLRAHSSAG